MRELFFGLIRKLVGSGEPYLMTARWMVELLGEATERQQEMSELLDDMEQLARLDGLEWPEAEAAELRQDLGVIQLRQHLELDLLFNPRTRVLRPLCSAVVGACPLSGLEPRGGCR